MNAIETSFPAKVGSYQIDILFRGFPGKSTHHGGIGWSTVVLLRGHGRVVLLDTGGFGVRVPLKEKLKKLGLATTDVTDLLLSHSHWDHVVNYPLFTNAEVHIGRDELEWAKATEVGTFAVPELYVAGLAAHPRLHLIEEGMEVFPGIQVVNGPGHTPGHLVFILRGKTIDVIFAQDAAKSRADIVTRTADPTVDPALGTATLNRIWALWKEREGTILVPGHDIPMMLDGDQIKMLGDREAGIKAVLGDNPADETVFPIRW